jgi:hypothetical protein
MLVAALSVGAGLIPLAGTTHALAAGTQGAARLRCGGQRRHPDPARPGRNGRLDLVPARDRAVGRRRVVHGRIPSVGEDINSSAPTDVGWTARYNNRSIRAGDEFGISAVCASEPPGYTMRFKTVPNPAQTQSFAIATCPAGTVVLSGGALSSSISINVELLSAWPQSTSKFKAVTRS